MELDPNATTDLSEFFTKRFPKPEDREALAYAARVKFHEPDSDDPIAAWGGLVSRAREQSALPLLAKCAARRRPNDENLQGVAAVLNGQVWPPVPAPAVPAIWKQVGTLVALIGIAGVAWAASGPGEALDVAPTATTDALTVAAVEHTPPPTPPPPPTVQPVDAGDAAMVADEQGAQEAPEEPVQAPVEGSDAAPEPASETTPAPAPAATPVGEPEEQVFIGCSGPVGQLVGYWYAGRASPGKKGERITVPRDLNVRADYPDHHNNYNRRAKIRCTLGVGQSLVLTADPILVPGDAYWVPLHATGPRRRR